MTDNSAIPKWFWVIGLIGLLWNGLGAFAYLSQVTMGPEQLATLPPDQQALYTSIPAWANGAFAVAVWAGVAGCLALLLKKTLALPLLGLSLSGVLVQMFHSFFVSNSLEVFGPGGLVMPMMVLIIACYLLWLSVRANRFGWLS